MLKRNQYLHVRNMSCTKKKDKINLKKQKITDKEMLEISQCKNNNDQTREYINRQKEEESYCIPTHKEHNYKCQQAVTRAQVRWMNLLRERLVRCILMSEILTARQRGREVEKNTSRKSTERSSDNCLFNYGQTSLQKVHT